LNDLADLFVAVASRLLNNQNRDKLFFHFFKNILNGREVVFVVSKSRLKGGSTAPSDDANLAPETH